MLHGKTLDENAKMSINSKNAQKYLENSKGWSKHTKKKNTSKL